MHPLSPALVVAAGSAVVGRSGFTAAKPEVDSLSSAAFVGHIGHWALYDEEAKLSTWPFALDADCDALARAAAERGILSAGHPEAGAIYLHWSRHQRQFTIAGIVIVGADAVEWPRTPSSYGCVVVEGGVLMKAVEDVDARSASPELVETDVQWARRTRVTFDPEVGDRFISWVDLDERNETTRLVGRAA
jgi:hypothetical protein